MARPAADGGLDAAIRQLRRRYGDAALRRGGDPVAAATWSTGVPAVDGLCSGGLPQGRISVLCGAVRGTTGRLTLLQAFAAAASRSDIDGGPAARPCGSALVAYVDLAGSLDPGFLADLGADLDACLVVRPPSGSPAVGLAMARALVAAGVPWLGVGIGRGPAWRRDPGIDHAVAALAAAVEGSRAVACLGAPSPLAAPLAYASSLTLVCRSLGWQEAHGDVVGLRVGLEVVKSKLGVAGGEAAVLLRYPRPQVAAEVVGIPAVLPGEAGEWVAAVAGGSGRAGDRPAWRIARQRFSTAR